ncbi:MAG: hypothetical protein ACYDA0_06680 [Candidatus Dormibacteraceae bacterium]
MQPIDSHIQLAEPRAGFALKFACSLGILYGLFVWSVADGFRLSFLPGATTGVGAAIIYSVLFLPLQLVDAGRFSVDSLIADTIPAWRWVSELRR